VDSIPYNTPGWRLQLAFVHLQISLWLRNANTRHLPMSYYLRLPLVLDIMKICMDFDPYDAFSSSDVPEMVDQQNSWNSLVIDTYLLHLGWNVGMLAVNICILWKHKCRPMLKLTKRINVAIPCGSYLPHGAFCGIFHLVWDGWKVEPFIRVFPT
jgi:hypothetical protein